MIHPGIDLGTTYSMIAHVNAYGHPALFPDLVDASQFRTASAIYLGPEGCLIGASADDLLENEVDIQIARYIKSLLTQPDYRYTDHLGRNWNPVGLSALIIKKMLRDAAVFSGEEIGTTVVTVPAQFTDDQRRATLAAAALAGLKDVRLIEEPVAAGIYYGQQSDGDRTLMVYDFGGGTFDVTLLQASPEGLFVLASDGDSNLGGRNIDQAIMELVDEDMSQRFSRSPLADPIASQRLRKVSEDAKISLSRQGSASVRRSVLLAGHPYDFVLTRSQLDLIAESAVARSIAACERCLTDSGLDWRDLDQIMLTGGSSLLPQAAVALAEKWRRPAQDLSLKQPHQAVAFGAAILAQRLGSSQLSSPAIRQVATADLCLKVRDETTGQPKLETLIARNTPLPARHTRVIYTSRADQDHVTLDFVQARGGQAANASLGRFRFGPISTPRLDYPVELEVLCGPEGLVQVSARDRGTGQSMELLMHESAGADMRIDEQRRLVESVDLGSY